MIVAFALAYKRGYINPHYGMSGFIPFSVTSVLVATVLSMVVSRTLLTPIRKVSDATKKIAKGDFSTRISENSFIEEIANVGKNFNLMELIRRLFCQIKLIIPREKCINYMLT
jgi:nitrogen fixation/metabolism regulation signal transduction histidine kinase